MRKRLEDPGRVWKISDGNCTERAFWPAGEAPPGRTGTAAAPGYVILYELFRDLAVARIVAATPEEAGCIARRSDPQVSGALRSGGAAAGDRAGLGRDRGGAGEDVPETVAWRAEKRVAQPRPRFLGIGRRGFGRRRSAGPLRRRRTRPH